MSKKLICVLSGKTTIVTDEYYSKRIEDFKHEDELKKYYVCRQVKTLLKRGYTQQEIRDNLKIDKKIVAVSDEVIKRIMQIENSENALDIALSETQKSDPEVVIFINQFKTYVHRSTEITN